MCFSPDGAVIFHGCIILSSHINFIKDSDRESSLQTGDIMNLRFCSLASGSSGNCFLIQSRETAILIDAGISTKKIHHAMEELDVPGESIHGVFITHEHTDHVRGIRVLTKKNPDWKVYTSRGTGDCIRDMICDPDQLQCFSSGQKTEIGDLLIRSFSISHDAADPVCYSVTCGDAKITILTDTGIIPQEAEQEMLDSSVIVLEANHEVNMLKAGSYPYSLKRRILGDHGHLSNEDAGMGIQRVMSEENRFRRVYLAHLSEHNNFPGLARQTVINLLEEKHFYHGRHFDIEVLRRDGISAVTEL